MVSLMSCDKYDEIHKDYVDSMDETKYSVNPENVILHSGLERLFVSTDLVYTSSLSKFIVEINDEMHEFDIPMPVEGDTTKLMYELPNLAEGVVDTYLYTIDNEDNKSLVTLYTGRVLGDRYRSEILNRNILRTESVSDGYKIKFNSAPEKSVRVDLTYTNQEDVSSTLRLLSENDELVIGDYKSESEYTYVTYYLADENSIDTLATTTVISQFFPERPVDRSSWEILSVTSEQLDGGPATSMLDGDLNTYWHNRWSGGTDPMPHVMVIDMKKEMEIRKIDFHRRKDSDSTRGILLETSMDNSTWKEYGTARWAEGAGNEKQVIEPEGTKNARYLRVSVIEVKDDPWMAIAELYLYE